MRPSEIIFLPGLAGLGSAFVIAAALLRHLQSAFIEA